ncbi:MAG: hypothetical protein K2X86_09610 [Cytophagaceae bacterium]|nr:hypothetical protein [Cytophagaceae bacterium]
MNYLSVLKTAVFHRGNRYNRAQKKTSRSDRDVLKSISEENYFFFLAAFFLEAGFFLAAFFFALALAMGSSFFC